MATKIIHRPDDLEFYAKLEVPPPTLVPLERLRHRLTFRNERSLHKRTSSLSGKPLISIYAPESPFTIYAIDEWWSDKWDGLAYGREIDFGRPFFEQFAELQSVVPRIALFNVNPENSDYCQQAYNNRNCYLCTVIKDCEDCMYISHSNKVRDSFDCDYVQNVELCYDCLDSERLYGCVGCEHCQTSHGLFFCVDCIGCSDCVGSWGLRNQRHVVGNVQRTPQEFDAIVKGLNLQSRSHYLAERERLLFHARKSSDRREYNINTEDCVGASLINAKESYECYDSFAIECCSYCTWTFESHHCADIYGMGTSEWVYESIGVENLNFAAYNTFVSDSSNAFYSDLCFYSADIFGCVGLRRGRQCILNREYSPDDYSTLRAKLIEHMKETGEWGRFFPSTLSPFAYNESVAAERFPLSKEQVLELGYRWRDSDAKEFLAGQLAVPNEIAAVTDDTSKAVLACERTGKNYRLTPQELAFLRKMSLPPPSLCPDARYAERMARRGIGTT